MRILVACESSSIISHAFREHPTHPHESYSCDIKPSEIDSPYHIQADALSIAYAEPWDLLIGHPPCRYLSLAGNAHFRNNPRRHVPSEEAADFAQALWDAPIGRICLENPTSRLANRIGPSSYTYQPWYFGEQYQKFACLWLKNLPPLRQTHFKKPHTFLNRDALGRDNHPDNPDRATNKSRTLPGVARAFADSWCRLQPL